VRARYPGRADRPAAGARGAVPARFAYWALAGLAACALAAPIAVSPALSAEERVTLNFVNTEVDAVVRAVAEFTGKSFIIDPRVKGTMNLSIERSLTREQALAALTAALRLQGYAVVESGGIMRVVPEADAKLQGGSVQIGRAPRALGGDQLVTQVFRLNYESAANLVQVLRPLIAPNNTINAYPGNNTLVVTDYAENVKRIARIIAAIDTPAGSGIDVVQLKHAIASDVGALLVRLLETSAPGGDASQRVSVLAEPSSNSLLIRSSSAARANLVRDLIAKLDQPAAAAGNIHVVHLKNAEAVQLARTLLGFGGTGASGATSGATYAATQAGQMAQPAQATRPAGALQSSTGAAGPVAGQMGGAQIQADPTTNTLIITAPDAVYRQLRTVIDTLDVRRAQVLIESLIVEVSSDQAAEFGIQWMGGLQNAASSQTSVVGGTNFGGAGQNIVGAAANLTTLGKGMNIGVIRGQVTLPGVGTVTNLQMLARALETNSRSNILSTPNILTLDNEEAKIVVGQNVPFVTGQYVGAASAASATVNPFQTIERRDVGLTLRVRPQISEGGTVKLVIYQEVSSVQDLTNAAGIITNKRSIDTNVLVDDGAIVVLGGLIEDTVAESTEKVPLLGDIPFLGALFRYESRKRVKTNLMVFLRPYVVRDERASGSLTMDRYDYMRALEEQAKPESRIVLPDMTPAVLPPQGGATIPAAAQAAEQPAGAAPAPGAGGPPAASEPAQPPAAPPQPATLPAAAPAAAQPAESPAAAPAAPQ
jgi:general secretion pathway protein D